MTLSYLVSTAGHAQHQNDTHPHEIQSILQLIVDGAKEFKDEKVVGFTRDGGDGWVCERYSFVDLLSLAAVMEDLLIKSGVPRAQEAVVSLLCPTGLDFLVGWIALMRMGYGVVFTAPQCSPSAISHLANSSSSTHIIYHPKYADLAKSVHPLSSYIPLVELPPTPALSQSAPLPVALELTLPHPHSISHIFHTSGTSGTPKPIPQTHYRSVNSLPRRALPSYLSHYASGSGMAPGGSAAFTTTPLFHGGVSDLLRAWMARSMIYFYPTSDTAITMSNVVKAVEQCNGQLPPPPLLPNVRMGKMTVERESERRARFRVIAFLSVPYILTILAEDQDGPGMALLREMELVSTGGAPLDTEVGNKMVEAGVRLVSRLGSSECGFLLSSHRDYHTEHDWEWLRNDSPYADALVFEPREDNAHEMVVTDRWRSKSKSNRDDGSYATGDLYIPHDRKPNVWKYIGRGDDVLVMSNGEKAAPGPIESILRSSPLIADALVVGSEQSQLGVLLFPRSNSPSSTILNDITSYICRANDASPSFAQISAEMCLIVDRNTGKELPKSSKGTVQRGVANDLYKEEIKSLYAGTVEGGRQGGELPKRTLEEIEGEVKQLIVGVVKTRLNTEGLQGQTDLFSWGVDSLMATRIRSGMIRSLNLGGGKLATNVVFERPTIKGLAQHVFELQEHIKPSDSATDALQLMHDLAEKYGTFTSMPDVVKRDGDGQTATGRIILLTGATGSLGTHLLDQLLVGSPDHRVICLVRAADDAAAAHRVKDAMAARDLQWDEQRVEAYAADLGVTDLGLGEEVYGRLVRSVDVVIHAAWPVHFGSSLISFDVNIKGTRNLINLTAQTPSAKLFFCSSLASVLASPPSITSIAEQPTNDPGTASSIGYSQSKWVTERVCVNANEALGGGRVTILRVGQLCGDTVKGRWSEKEGWPLMIRTAEEVGCLPLLDEKPSWLPVNVAAKAIVEITSASPSQQVYHIAHPTPFVWTSLLDQLHAAGLSFERVDPKVWVEKMEQSEEDLERNPSRGMLGMWREAFGANSIPALDRRVETSNAEAASASLQGVEDIGEGLVQKMVGAWRDSGFLSDGQS